MSALAEWTEAVLAELGLDGPVDRDLVLDLARDVAHGVARPAAPLTTFLVGLAAGRAGWGGQGPGQARAVEEAVARVRALVARWEAGPPATS